MGQERRVSVDKRTARRWVCSRVAMAIAAGLVEDEAASMSDDDRRRIDEAAIALRDELTRRAGEESETV
jgi:transposase-like protein